MATNCRSRLVRLALSGVISIACASAAAPGIGTVNSIEGEVSIDGVAVVASSNGSTVAAQGHVVSTGEGLAEILLNPGTILRLGHHSEVAMLSPVKLIKGEVMIAVVELPEAGPIALDNNGVVTTIQAPGVYDFKRNHGVVEVYDGSAQIASGDRQVTLKKGFGSRSHRLRGYPVTPDESSPLYSWSRFRSEQLSRESASSVQLAAANAKPPSHASWLWDPWSNSYTFISASGFVNGPFGWPFYAPGHSHNYIPEHSGESFLYGPPIPKTPAAAPAAPAAAPRPGVPLTAPGVPTFPNNRKP